MFFFVQDHFTEHYKGGAELTTEALIEGGLFPCNKVLSSQLTPEVMKKYINHFWIFGNFANLSNKCLLYAIKNLSYSIIEYDYKYCNYRSPQKHVTAEGKCDCHEGSKGKLTSIFFNNAKALWWMSKKQMEIYQNLYPFLNNNKSRVLSSIFSDETLNFISDLNTSKKNDKWIILNSPSWIKGVEEAVKHASENDLEYELVWGLDYEDLLQKLAVSRGVIFFPRAADTCPRLIIEAKLLGCELILNDNVQHADEEWFLNKDTINEYLRGRSSFFWDKIENISYQETGIPFNTPAEEDIKFNIVVPFYNVEKWIRKCIKSLKKQKYSNFECTLINDISTDESLNIVKREVNGDSRFKVINNKEKKYALRNIAESIRNSNCTDDEVIILLDGDDWFASSNTLNKLRDIYVKEECFLTYGSYVFNPGGGKGPEPSQYPDDIIKANSFRQDFWRASHLRSFKHKLWKHIDARDMKDNNGEYYKMTYDQAIMLPLLELAGEKSKYIPEILYVYNKENPLNVDKIKTQEQVKTAREIRNKKSYKAITKT